MPELPEVETVRRCLEMHIQGRTITSVDGVPIRLRRPLEPEKLASAIGGRRILQFRRRGKFLLIDIEPSGSLLVHLGMTGRLQIAQATEDLLPHTHLILGLDDQRQLRFSDARRFGLVDWLDQGEEHTDSSLRLLGLEPLDPSLPECMPPLFHTRRAAVKSLLMDQRLVVGVGNIYAAEALWRSGIRPNRGGCRTSLKRLRKLAVNVQEILLEAIDQGGTTLRDYANPEGELGYFAIKLQVYGRQGKPCLRCESTLRADVIGGRTTCWCRRCQT